MTFFRTPLQRKILKNYWKDNKPFTIDSLCEQKVVRYRLWGSLSIKMMLKKHQIIQGIDADGKEKLIGTTDSQEEWKQLLQKKRLAKDPFIIPEDFGLSGLNPYEEDAAIDEMITMIEEKKKEILARKNQKGGKGL